MLQEKCLVGMEEVKVKKVFLLKLEPDLVKEILNSVIQDMTHDFFFTEDARGIMVYSGDSAKEFYALSLDWAVEEDDDDISCFSIPCEKWFESSFISKHLEQVLNEKKITTDFMFRKISNQKLFNILKEYLLETIDIKGLPRKKRVILDMAFIESPCDRFYKCIAIMSTQKTNEFPSIEETDRLIDYTEGDIGLIRPIYIKNTLDLSRGRDT